MLRQATPAPALRGALPTADGEAIYMIDSVVLVAEARRWRDPATVKTEVLNVP